MGIVRLHLMCSLTFFVGWYLTACSKQKEAEKINIIWKDKKAIAVTFPASLPKGISMDSLSHFVKITLSGDAAESSLGDGILGEYALAGETVFFTPLVAFTHGLHYEIRADNHRIGDFVVPQPDAADAPKLLAIYPTQDTLPENLLKIYLHFSRPMREGLSDQYVSLVKNEQDTISGAFLNLQPELWNADRTTLTLWLDPGRTKRDLIPNKTLGAPLQKNYRYQIVVSSAWRDQQGLSLPETYTKAFTTATRDSLSPDVDRWNLLVPAANASGALEINFGEPLDYALLNETLNVKNDKGLTVQGKWVFSDEEKKGSFTPADNWKSGRYTLQVESRLEDLSGNNMNRPFDRDVTKSLQKSNGKFSTLEFRIR